MAVGGVNSGDCSTGAALGPALAVHLDADAALGDAADARCEACTACEFSGAVVGTPAKALAEKIVFETRAFAGTRAFVGTLCMLEFFHSKWRKMLLTGFAWALF